MKIYTRTGDDGTTGLFGAGRVGKNHPRISAYGTVDELNAVLGLAMAYWQPVSSDDRLYTVLHQLQNELFVVGGDLASPEETSYPVPRITQAEIDQLERYIDGFNVDLPPLRSFILPGGHVVAATLQVARTICRRAERNVVTLSQEEPGVLLVQQYLNRLSDLLFTLARWVNVKTQTPETPWVPIQHKETKAL
ncbi:MAG TPA: cob(I)yrinic acid a,c-diamide adenosyltransferase [Rhodothermales bacterium]|nr:cob(I)yrinic acid a,c-diamide adenosyltransferase [Bacteroidota bacterium]HRK72974.1 cob(I)yrinic acid a,c-diamide adenosyltransferase [Rhodothermales bacterium]HRR09219.1 cob(I)yrinic acid a,c-diamide adenosyltransferase [Rhodothermales bacterium]